MIKRDSTLDTLRVASMILVIVIHVANCYCRDYAMISNSSYFFAVVFNALARVSVPIFFMISGALLIGKKHTKEKYLSRIIRMTIILAIWTIIYYIWNIVYLENDPGNIISLLFVPERTLLWFMYAIIALYIALPFISKMVKNLTKKEEDLFIMLWLIFNGITYLVTIITGDKVIYPVPIISGAYYLGYFIIGYIIYNRVNKKKEKKYDLKKYNKYLMLTFILSNIIIVIVTIIFSNINNTYSDSLFAYKNIFLVLSSVSIYIYTLINLKKEVKITKKIAPYSLGIYLVHGLILNILYYNIAFEKINSLIGIPIFSIILFLLAYGIIYLIKKIPRVNNYVC